MLFSENVLELKVKETVKKPLMVIHSKLCSLENNATDLGLPAKSFISKKMKNI